MLSNEEYTYIQKSWSLLKDDIKEKERLVVHHEGKVAEAQADLLRLAAEENFFSNKMHSALKEYEDAHQGGIE